MNTDYKHIATKYLDDYWVANKDNITPRLVFLLQKYENMPDYAGPSDIYYYFEEARHTFMMGDFVASIIMCACTIELWMSHLLKIPYYQPRGTANEFDEKTFEKLLDCCVAKGFISTDENKKLKKLMNMRTFYVHGKDVSKEKGCKRESKEKSKFWSSPELQRHYGVKSIGQDAQEAIEILFSFYKEHHYSKQL